MSNMYLWYNHLFMLLTTWPICPLQTSNLLSRYTFLFIYWRWGGHVPLKFWTTPYHWVIAYKYGAFFFLITLHTYPTHASLPPLYHAILFQTMTYVYRSLLFATVIHIIHSFEKLYRLSLSGSTVWHAKPMWRVWPFFCFEKDKVCLPFSYILF